MSNINIKNVPKLKLSDLLRRRKMTLIQYMDEFGINTYAGLTNTCARMGVLPPDVSEFEKLNIKKVSNPSEGVVVIESKSANIEVETPIDSETQETKLEPTEPLVKTKRKKRDIAQTDIDE